jgi:hypothetical protein
VINIITEGGGSAAEHRSENKKTTNQIRITLSAAVANPLVVFEEVNFERRCAIEPDAFVGRHSAACVVQ